LRGAGSETRRVVTFAKSLVPWALNTMLTAHSPVLTPWLDWIVPALASVMSEPSVSTGPRR